MSYDLYLHANACASCGRRDTDFHTDPTYNFGPMFDLALTGRERTREEIAAEKATHAWSVHCLNGRRARDTIELLTEALVRLEDPKLLKRFRALEPENKWGAWEGACEVLQRLRRAAVEYPDHVWEVH